MKPPRHYATPQAFKQALEQQLRSVAKGQNIARRRQLLVFDRYLARLDEVLGPAVTLKGGLVLELRLERARATRDIDLRLTGSHDGLLQRLQAAGRLELGDYMTFELQLDTRNPEITGDGAKYGGQRFRAQCRIAGLTYAQPFGVDVGFGDPILGEPELVQGDDLLSFAGVAAPTLRIYPVESHISEKLHAYTLPRPTENTRVKDLPDLALLGQTGRRDARRVRAAIAQTFSFRKTHAPPFEVPSPPVSWAAPYAALAQENALPWSTLDAVTAAVRQFLDPVLTSTTPAEWDPTTWTWSAS
jgi:hypothetical protein